MAIALTDRRGGRWRPRLGAVREAGGVRFRVWAPERTRVDLLLDPEGRAPRAVTLDRDVDGTASALIADAAAGTRYAYRLDGDGPFPDPASRSQPDGVHRPSAVVDPATFGWSDDGWRGVRLADAVIYELHVGTFTPEGTFRAASARLPDLVALGITVVELMPVADFPGARNWGYDGVSLFAPARAYGRPDDLRALVNEAHRLGLAVMLDVVYNHFGPDGAYCSTFSPHYISTRHTSPWGAAVNLDGPHAAQVRAFFLENALHWLHEYHVDGLRLDATHALIDEGPRHFLHELCDTARASLPDRTLLLIAEDERNLDTLVRAPAAGGWGLDAVWADDFHHQVRRHTAGDRDGYYVDFTGSMTDLAATIRRGWFFCGQHSQYLGHPRGSDPAGIDLARMVICIQNHDQIGNRPFGRRLHHQIEAAAYRAASTLLLTAPETPLLFMGQEWAASARFLFFTDHHPELGALVTQGRRHEFSRFAAFADPAVRDTIPDPQALDTVTASTLRWDEIALPPHAGTLALYKALLHLRRSEPALQAGGSLDLAAREPHGLAMRRAAAAGPPLLVVVAFDSAVVTLDDLPWAHAAWTPVLSTEDTAFVDAADRRAPAGITVAPHDGAPLVTFARAGAIILRER